MLMMETPKADLSEAMRLLDAGLHLVRLKQYSKQPLGNDWNAPSCRARSIDPDATGYGLPLVSNHACSVDPDNQRLATRGMAALGFDLEKIMAAGVRTQSTRPGSGGRAAFAEEPDLSWLRFSSRDPKLGTIIEFRAGSPNLQDVVPGLIYYDKAGNPCTQAYANDRRWDDLPGLPDELLDWWQRCSTDIEFYREQQAKFFAAIESPANLAISTGRGGSKLAFEAPGYRGRYNEDNTVESVLQRHGYTWHPNLQRWSPPTATGAPGVRPIPGKDGLWQSDHASDPLAGTFDAWVAHVVLDHYGDVEAAKRAMAKDEFDANPLPAEVDPQTGEIKPHPLADFVDIEAETFTQEEFVLDSVLVAGMVLVAGAWGAGKTTQLVPLMCRAAHLCRPDDPLRPLLRRRVVYIAEDIGQVRRIMRSMRHAGEFDGISAEEVADWFKLVSARRMAPSQIVTAAAEYAKLATVNRNPTTGVEFVAQAVVVFDTRSAVIALEDENDNTEASAAIATFRQGMPDNPMVVVGHIAKALKRADVKDLSSRGAGAWEADVQQVLYLVNDDGIRWLDVANPKHRFVAQVDGIEFDAYKASTAGVDQLGNPVDIPLMHGIPKRVGLGERGKERVEEARQRMEDIRKGEEIALRGEVFDRVKQAWDKGNPYNREALKAAMKGTRRETVVATIETLLQEQWLVEVEVPRKQRTHPKRTHYLVILSDEERREYMEKNVLPADKLEVPKGWRKPEVSTVPETGNGCPEIGGGEA